MPGRSVSGKVARLAAAGSVGKYSAPCWPQPLRPAPMSPAAPMVTAMVIATVTGIATARAAWAPVLTRIWGIHNILKL